MKKETILNIISTCMIVAGSATVGAAVAACIESNKSEARIKELRTSMALNEARISRIKELVNVNNNRISVLTSKVIDMQCKLDNVE